MVRAARTRPNVLHIGLDADPTRMRRASQRAPANAIFVVAAAESLPTELDGAVSELSILFPWGSLLRGLVAPSPEILSGIARVLRRGGTLAALLSLTERDGSEPLDAETIDRAAYASHGLRVVEWRAATTAEIAASESSWAKRLGVDRDRVVWRLVSRRA